MAVIRLALEIDEAVYPELHAALSAIERPASREERLRQLAATGLVWEAVRMRGPAVLPPEPAPAASATAPAPEPVMARPVAAKPQRTKPPPAKPRAPKPQVPVLQDVVDLPPWTAPVPDEPPAPPPLEGEARRTGARSARLKRMHDRGLFKNG